jgi:hypothetical protein
MWLDQRFSNCGARTPGGAVFPLGGGVRVDCMRDIFILNEIWVPSKIYILIRTLLGWIILRIAQY